jgi:HPt (histidine-containing phosphotransfer) domain-containing protein
LLCIRSDFKYKVLERPLLEAEVLDRSPEPRLPSVIGALRDVSPPVPSPTAESETVVFDCASVLSRLEGDNELAQVVFAVFLEDLPRQIQALQDLVDSGDTAGCARQAHSIRGAAASVGGERLRGVALTMEEAGDSGNLQFVAARMNDLHLEFSRLRDAMKFS